ncbi:MAG: hypothetical protein JWN18_237 [Parcubacteria group bacterium]|nr:hypothetical protein [Parcubacteria group bacterium]
MEFAHVYNICGSLIAIAIGILILTFPKQALEKQRKTIIKLAKALPSIYTKALTKTERQIMRDNFVVACGLVGIGFFGLIISFSS